MKLEGIVVSEKSYKSEDEDEIIYSNIDFVNSLFQEYVYAEEVSDDALKSYYVDYYLAQLENGGFSQFVYNSGWEKNTVRYVREGLGEIGASGNLALFNRLASVLDGMGAERIEQYLNGEYFGINEERDILDSFYEEFDDLEESEDLASLNSRWLRQHEKLEVLKEEEYQEKIRSITQSIPDRNLRAQKALEAEPRYMKLIRELCKESGHILDRVTAGDSIDYEGVEVWAWHFLTNLGHHYMIDYEGKAIMYSGGSGEAVVTIAAGQEY